jgi:hypothetical protein
MVNPKLLIDRLLESELANREDNLARAQMDQTNSIQMIMDYEDDVQNIKQAISLWKRVRPQE